MVTIQWKSALVTPITARLSQRKLLRHNSRFHGEKEMVAGESASQSLLKFVRTAVGRPSRFDVTLSKEMSRWRMSCGAGFRGISTRYYKTVVTAAIVPEPIRPLALPLLPSRCIKSNVALKDGDQTPRAPYGDPGRLSRLSVRGIYVPSKIRHACQTAGAIGSHVSRESTLSRIHAGLLTGAHEVSQGGGARSAASIYLAHPLLTRSK